MMRLLMNWTLKADRDQSFCFNQCCQSRSKSHCSFYPKAWGKDQRKIYVQQLDDAFHKPADTPLAGKPCDHIKTGYKKFPVGSHIIFFTQKPNASIQIVRILHKRMDVEPNMTAP